MFTSIVLSSEKKVYNVADIEEPVEMNWNQDRSSKGKRGFGHIYLGKLTGDQGFETYLKDLFMTELGIHIEGCVDFIKSKPSFLFGSA